jgi:hypothetical protein
VWYTQAHDLVERTVGFVSNDHGDRGGVKVLKDRRSLAYGPGRGERNTPHTCLLPVSGYGSDRVGVEQHYVSTRVSPTQPGAETIEATKRTKRKQAEKQAG